jgi:hypothetical protein
LMGLAIRYWAPRDGIGWVDDDYFDQHLSWFRKWREEYSQM